jgi:light-regulated signal transduction histidine kinase (bacteriophytochrome)
VPKFTAEEVLQALPDLKFLLNKEGFFLNCYIHPEAEYALLVPPKDFIGKHINAVLPPHLAKAFIKNLEKALDTGKTSILEYPLFVDSKNYFFEARINAIDETHAIILVRDITEIDLNIKKLRHKVEELAKARKELEARSATNIQLDHFAHTVSHDLREPIRTMKSFSQLLKRRYGEQLDKDANEYLDFISSAANFMSNMITDMLEYSVVADDTKVHPVEKYELNKIIGAALSKLQEEIEETNADIQLPDNLPFIAGNYTQLVQLFENLFSNALKFHLPDTPPLIIVEYSNQKNYWKFSIRDNGIGIPSEEQDNIFTLFLRLHSKRIYPGSGIGLALCKRIVQQHGGEIWVDSEESQGSTFHFTLHKSGQPQE